MAPFSTDNGRDEESDEEEDEEEAPTHLPLAPSSELFDTSTTVDPSYIISLIRRLLPCDVRVVEHSQKVEYAVHGCEIHSLEPNMNRDHNCEKTTIATEPIDNLGSCRNLTDDYEENVDQPFVRQKNSPDSTIDIEMSQEIVKKEKICGVDDGQTEHSDIKDPWEDCGCILWDLSASIIHAEFMVNNLLLEVLVGNLRVSKSFRITEICLGIFGNLACHNALSKVIASTNGLIETVVNQLFLDDAACLSETIRLLAVGLQSSGFASWGEALQPEQILLRILWIVGNTLNSTLLERSIDFLLAIVDNQEVATVLLQPLVELGLPNLVVSLLACEISKSRDENKIERSSFLDVILRLVEGLSTIDSYSHVISSNEKLFHLVCDVVKLPDKIEVASSCVSAVVIIANLLVDDRHLALTLSQDFPFLQNLLEILPFVSDDSQARNALWCILARSLDHVKENDVSVSILHQFASLFLDKSHMIEEVLDNIHPAEDSGEDQSIKINDQSYEVATALRRISCILERWIVERRAVPDKDGGSDDGSSKVHKLLNYCRKYGSSVDQSNRA